MSSTASSPGVDYLLYQLGAVRTENRRLRRRVRQLTVSRDHWRREARAWKWGALRSR